MKIISKFLQNSYVETLILFIITFVISRYISPTDPLFFHSQFNIYFYLLLVISLFYGFFSAIFYLIIFFSVEYFIYHKLNFNNLYQYIIIMLILSEFFYFWKNKLTKLQETNKYLNTRLENIGTAYYLLKLSHDEIEQNYILKPFSIRNVLNEIKSLMKKNPQEATTNFLLLLERIFKIEHASLYILENGKYKLKETIGDEIVKLDLDDGLLKRVLTKKELVYADISQNEYSNYLAVIPLISLNHDIKGLFLIKEIPFFNLSKDNLLMISLFLSYFINNFSIINKYKQYNFDEEFLNEIDKLLFLEKKYHIKTFLAIFESNDFNLLNIKQKLRGNDIYYRKENKLIVLFPFMTSNGVKNFISRIENIENIKYKVLNFHDYKTLEEIIKEIDNG